MNIAIVSEVAPGTWGGVTTVISHLVDYLHRENHSLAFISPKSEQPLPDVFLRYDFPRHFLPAFQLPLYNKTTMAVRLDRTARELLDRFRPDIVHLIDPWLIGPQAGSWAARRSIPVVSSFHTDVMAIAPHFNKFFPTRAAWKICRFAHRHAAITLSPTRTVTDRLERNGFNNLGCWGRGVDTDLYSPDKRDTELRKHLLGRDKEHIVLFTGRVSKDKNIRFILDALVDNSSIRLVVAGNGPSFGELKSAYESRGVIFTGYLDSQTLARYYASSDLLAFASQTDTYGQVLNEALASGLPVVAAGNAVVKEVLSDVGIYYPPGDVSAFRRTINHLLEDQQKREEISKTGLQLTAERTWKKSIEQLLNHFKMVLEKDKPG